MQELRCGRFPDILFVRIVGKTLNGSGTYLIRLGAIDTGG